MTKCFYCDNQATQTTWSKVGYAYPTDSEPETGVVLAADVEVCEDHAS